ncbi:MAG: hypothetical protein D6E12_10970 [Desulfovibrio sp.]|nr:MAG: hypothetical protein D6E12_10970 [Desulfovibrio sp.]
MAKEAPTGMDYLVRGILIGGSLGVFIGLSGILDINIARGAGLGMIAGFLGGLTLARKRADKDTMAPSSRPESDSGDSIDSDSGDSDSSDSGGDSD